jgi:hypothetical protein
MIRDGHHLEVLQLAGEQAQGPNPGQPDLGPQVWSYLRWAQHSALWLL